MKNKLNEKIAIRNMQNAQHNSQGITLVTLVITIIVLLILARVSIAILTGEKGILQQATKAKESTKTSLIEEQRKLAQLEASMNLQSTKYIDTSTGTTLEVPIPEGFAVTGVEGENTVKDGLVITDSIGNEFVWVPVPNAILDLTASESILQSDEEVKEVIANAKDSEGNQIYPMAIKLKNNENNIYYIGVLYGFSDYNSSNKTTNIAPYANWTPISKTKYREPDVNITYDYITTYLDTINSIMGTNYNTKYDLLKDIQEEYQKLVEEINENKGFYISRYEMSIDSNKRAQSKYGATSLTSSYKPTETDDYYRWYGLYATAHTYTNSSGNISSAMILGSQWDQMLIWFANNGIDVTSVAGMNNFDITGNSTIKNNSADRITGTTNFDKLCNIFDLFGNSYEWTTEVNGGAKRVGGGGSYNEDLSLKNRKNYDSNNYSGMCSTRFTLFCK